MSLPVLLSSNCFKIILRWLGFDFGGIKVKSISEGLKIADYVSLHMPLTDETKDLINYSILKEMKKNAFIVNTARGGIINEIDLDIELLSKMALDDPSTNGNPKKLDINAENFSNLVGDD